MSGLSQQLQSLLDSPTDVGLHRITKGIEKESLRINADATLAMTPHPLTLGSALTHPSITTDYSEALLEFITQPQMCTASVLKELKDLHAYTYQNINGEHLWATSMPCALGADHEIPIARYGRSNSGLMKSVYRMGLGHRYGRSMQTIAGIHYNFSLPDELWQYLHTEEQSRLSLQDFKTQGYFRLIRNFRRNFWVLLYLFGASPSVCKSFVRNRQHQLVPFNEDEHSLHTPYATSLRMGDLGYQSKAQDSLVITYNCLESYIQTLCCAITQPHPDYVATGVLDKQEQYQQLNHNLLQIENEFYSVIRPKRTAQRGETALSALANRGIEYIEVRCLDINPYELVGISESDIAFLDTFLLYCALQESPVSNEQECRDIKENQHRMVYHGRDPELTLLDNGKERSMRDWGKTLLQELSPIAQLLDNAYQNHDFSRSLDLQNQKLADDKLTPSAQILADMASQQLSFYNLAAQISKQRQADFKHYDLGKIALDLKQLAQSSLQQQKELEATDTISFTDYLSNYYSQYQCAATTEEAQPAASI